MPRRLVMPAAAANRKARPAPNVAINSTDDSDIHRLRGSAKLFREIDNHEITVPSAVGAPFGIQDQILPRVDVLVIFEAVLSPHPHELSAPLADLYLQRSPVCRFKLHLFTASLLPVRYPVTLRHKAPLSSRESGIPERTGSFLWCNRPSRCTSAIRQPRSRGCRRSGLDPLRRTKDIVQSSSSRSSAAPGCGPGCETVCVVPDIASAAPVQLPSSPVPFAVLTSGAGRPTAPPTVSRPV